MSVPIHFFNIPVLPNAERKYETIPIYFCIELKWLQSIYMLMYIKRNFTYIRFEKVVRIIIKERKETYGLKEYQAQGAPQHSSLRKTK